MKLNKKVIPEKCPEHIAEGVATHNKIFVKKFFKIINIDNAKEIYLNSDEIQSLLVSLNRSVVADEIFMKSKEYLYEKKRENRFWFVSLNYKRDKQLLEKLGKIRDLKKLLK